MPRRRAPIQPPINPNLLPGEQIDFRRHGERIADSIAELGVRAPARDVVVDGRQRALAVLQAERADDVAWYVDQLEQLAAFAEGRAYVAAAELHTYDASSQATTRVRIECDQSIASEARRILAGKTVAEVAAAAGISPTSVR